jgi:hypothetical protein
MRPVMAGRRSIGNQIVNTLMLDISPADTPRPISARPASRVVKLWLREKAARARSATGTTMR